MCQWPPDWRDYYALVAWRFDALDSVRLTDCLAHAEEYLTHAGLYSADMIGLIKMGIRHRRSGR